MHLKRLKYLMTRYESNTITRSEFDEFVTYIQNPDYQDTILELMDEGFRVDVGEIRLHSSKDLISRPKKLKKLKPWLLGSAALLLLLIVPQVYQQLLPKESHKLRTVATLNASIQEVTLADGSIVTLNAASKLIYPENFSDTLRAVTLEGEGFFDVVPDPDRPFVVSSGGVNTKVLGTSFNIQAYKDSKEKVSVASGRVLVFQKGRIKDKQVVLLPDQQAVYQDGKFDKRQVDMDEVMAWKQGVLLFKQSTLNEAVSILERKYDVDIKLEGRALRNCTVTGKFNKSTSLEKVLENFKYVLGIQYEYKSSNQIVIRSTGSGCQ